MTDTSTAGACSFTEVNPDKGTETNEFPPTSADTGLQKLTPIRGRKPF